MSEIQRTAVRRILNINPTYATVMYRNVDAGSRLLEFKEDFDFQEKRSLAQVKNEINLENNQHFGELSKKAYRRIRRSIEWLEYISYSKYNANGLEYKVSMITLTIPSFSTEIEEKRLKKVLNQFLTYARLNYNLISYVWKAELTKNGNLHYHLLTGDIFGSADVQSKWNELLYKEGLLDNYQSKFSKMSVGDYLNYRQAIDLKYDNKVVNAHEKYMKAYNFGTANNWLQPKSIQIDQIPLSDSIAGYVAKYLSKAIKDDEVDNEALQVLKGRIWGCSQNLSMKNKLSIQIDPDSANEQQMLQDLLSVSDSYEDIIFRDKLNIEKVVGYKLKYKQSIWSGDLEKSPLQKVFNNFVSDLKQGYRHLSYQEKQTSLALELGRSEAPHRPQQAVKKRSTFGKQTILFCL